ncbi:hypothetical protein AAGT10_15005 (plasmid) [Sulfolobus tengchongensis]|uniref:Transcriptional regulator n=1 Tax=Sulfolobus tengchongensis TaxID=207809 RepID=A0AAX4L401_9CREN
MPIYLISIRSIKIRKILEILVERPAIARELAKVIDSDSRNVEPRLKRYFGKLIVAYKINNMNIYSLKDEARDVVRQLLESCDSVPCDKYIVVRENEGSMQYDILDAKRLIELIKDEGGRSK